MGLNNNFALNVLKTKDFRRRRPRNNEPVFVDRSKNRYKKLEKPSRSGNISGEMK